MEAPPNSKETTPSAKAKGPRKKGPGDKPAEPLRAEPPTAEPPGGSATPDPDINVGLAEVLRETLPGLATLLAVAIAIFIGAIAWAVAQPYTHYDDPPAWTSLAFWTERQPVGTGQADLLSRADFYPRSRVGLTVAESLAVALLASSADGEVFIALPGGMVSLFPAGPQIATGLTTEIRSIAYSAPSQRIVLLDGQGVIHSQNFIGIDRASQQQAQSVSAQENTIALTPENYSGDILPAAAMSLAGDTETLVTVTDKGEIESFDITAKGIFQIGRRDTGVDLDSVAITPRASRGIAGGADGRLLLFTPLSDSEKALLLLEAHQAPVSAVAIADNGGTIVSADTTGRVRIGNGDGDQIAEFNIGAEGVAGLALSADGELLLSAGIDGRLRLWQRDGLEIGNAQRVAERIRSIATTPDLAYVAIAGTGVNAHGFELQRLNTRLPWFTLLAFALAGGLFVGFILLFVRAESWVKRRRQASGAAPASRVRAFLTSDGPVSDPRYAGEALNELALRLFRFLANRDTAAPVTLALTAEWGMGKSSAMRLLQRRLEDQGMPTIWFNAWHHQKEEQLFASLMEQIRRHATPGISRLEFFHPRNLQVRLRLLKTRLVEKPLRVLLFLGILAFLVTILADAPTTLSSFSVDTVKAIGAAGAAFLALQNLFKPFAQNPLNLVHNWGGWFAPTRFSNLLGVRDQFAEAFHEVSRALGPGRRMTIFIDDLDRCQKQQVVDVLEAVNFLVSTTECYIVLGVSERPVKNAVGLMFKELAEAHALDRRKTDLVRPADASAAADERLRALNDQQKFADSYLEKLINISIAIPPFDTEALKFWLQVNDVAPPPDDGDGKNRWLKTLGWGVRLVVIGAVLAGAIFAGSQIDIDADRDSAPAPSATEPAGSGAGIGNSTESGGSAESSTATDAGDIDSVTAQNETPAALTESTAANRFLEWRLAPLAVLLLLGLALLAFVPKRSRRWLGEIIEVARPIADLDAFKQSMEIYLPLVLDARQSPRAIKRFVNRMRFLTADLDENEATRVADLIAIATAHEIGLVSNRRSDADTATRQLAEKGGQPGQATWPSETWETYWDLFASASFAGDDGDASEEVDAVDPEPEAASESSA